MKKKYFNYMKKSLLIKKKNLILLILIIFSVSMIATLIPYTQQIITNQIFLKRDFQYFASMIIGMMILYCLQCIFSLLKEYVQTKTNETIKASLRSELNSVAAKKRYSDFLVTGSEELITRYTNDAGVISNHFSEELFNLGEQIVTLMLASYMVFRISPIVLLYILVVLTVYFLINKKIGTILNREIKKLFVFQEESLGCFSENYSNNFLVKIYNLYSWVEERFQKIYRKEYKQKIKTNMIYSSNINVTRLVINFLIVFIWLFSGYGIKNGTGDIGKLVALTGYVGLLVAPFFYFGQFNNSIHETYSSIERMDRELLAVQEESEKGEGFSDLCEIQIRDLYFTYHAEKFELRVPEFHVKKGEIIGIKGSSGCGKSTFVNLMLQLYPISGEHMYYNKIDCKKLQLRNIRDRIGYVTQDSRFFDGTIRENLFGAYSQEFIDKYAGKIDIKEDILNMQEEYNTVLKKNGSNLSGGQKKRIDILRVLLAEKDVLIFDEATSMLDQKRRNIFLDLLEELRKDKIIIVITHNNEEWESLDRIYKIENGIMYEEAEAV